MAAAPYVSHIKLFDHSHSAMLSAIELYNKPRIEYRNELTTILITNAWELALKGLLRRKRKRIFKRKRRGRPYESISLDQCLDVVSAQELWPENIDGGAVSVNVRALQKYRNNAIHLYNAKGLGSIIYSYAQQSILNFRDFLVASSGKDIAHSISWDLLPLGVETPSEAVQFMKIDTTVKSDPVIYEFIEDLRMGIETVERDGGDTGRIYTYLDVSLHQKKQASSADFSVALDPEAEGRIVTRKVDPNQTYPLNATKLLARINKRRKSGRSLNTHDRDAAVWYSGIKENPLYSWKHSTAPTYVYSHDAVTFLASKDDKYFDEAREAYRERNRKKK